MNKTYVLLNGVDKVKEFVNLTTGTDFDIDLVSGRYVIDAKSLMGVFSLDLSKPIELVLHDVNVDSAEKFIKKIEAYIVK